MSPDQGRGKSYDARSEIYSLGCVLFECLTGKPPFLGDNALATLSMHANDPVPSIQGQVEGTIEVELQSLLEKALAKEPDNRFQTVNEFRSSLEEIGRRSYAANAKSTTSPEPQKSRSAKVPVLIALALATATVSATGIALYNINSSKAKHAESKPERKVAIVQPHIADTTSSAIESGPIWSEVTDFSVEGMNLTDDSMKKLNEICPDMQTLEVAMSPNFTGVGLGFIKNKEKVKLIRVESAHFGERGAKKLLEFPNLSQVRVYYSNALSIDAIRTIARIPHLTHIELRDCTFPKDAISALSVIKKLTILDLTGSKPISKKRSGKS